MEIKINEKILEKYPELRIGIILARNLDNRNYNEEIQEMIREIEKKTRGTIDPEKVTEIPAISKWRHVYKEFGAKPNDYRNSVEALIKRTLKTELYRINLLVDIYNYISIKHIMTVGRENKDMIKGDLVLDFANGNEEFIPLGEQENKPPWEGEIVYKDNKGIICRCWNWREGDRTKLTEDTKNAIIVIENLLPERNEDLEDGLEELKKLVEKYCNADCEIKTLDKERISVNLD